MTRQVKDTSFVLAAAITMAAGCSTISRTEKQLAKVDSYDSPDIPAIGNVPPIRPRQTGLAYSPNTLIIYYDEGVGKGPLKKAAAKYEADVIYDYSIINALTIRIPDGKTLDEATKYFKKVKGVVEVSKDTSYMLDNAFSTAKPPDLVRSRELRCAPEPNASPRSLARALM